MKDFKKREWATPNRMKFESGFRTFDRQVDLIGYGNVISNVQHSSIVRPRSDTNGGACPDPGRCRKFDVDHMTSMRRPIPTRIREWLDSHPEEKVWLYDLHMRSGESVCWILTDYEHTKVILDEARWRRGGKNHAVLAEAVKYLVKGDWD